MVNAMTLGDGASKDANLGGFAGLNVRNNATEARVGTLIHAGASKVTLLKKYLSR